MKTLRSLRRQLNFSMEDMARCLGIKRSMVAGAEACPENLPVVAFLRLLKLNDYLDASDKVKDVEVAQDETSHLLGKYETAKFECDYQARKLQRQLGALRETYVKYQKTAKVLVMVERSGDIAFPTWLAVASINTRKKIINACLSRQCELERKIISLEAESNYLEQKIKEIKDVNKEQDRVLADFEEEKTISVLAENSIDLLLNPFHRNVYAARPIRHTAEKLPYISTRSFTSPELPGTLGRGRILRLYTGPPPISRRISPG